MTDVNGVRDGLDDSDIHDVLYGLDGVLFMVSTIVLIIVISMVSMTMVIVIPKVSMISLTDIHRVSNIALLAVIYVCL